MTQTDTHKKSPHTGQNMTPGSHSKMVPKRVKAGDWKLVNQITIDETRCAGQTTYEAAYERSADTTGRITIYST